METVALCADEISLTHPELIGLNGENLEAQGWLKTFSSAEEARTFLKGNVGVQEVWVASNEQVDPINLAAALKYDRPSRKVRLVVDEANGSLESRMLHAGLDLSMTSAQLAQRYREWKALEDMPPLATADSPTPVSSAKKEVIGGVGAEFASVGAAAAAVDQQGAQLGSAATFSGRAGEALPTSAAGFLLPVVSGSGGAGKSTIACLLALIAQRGGINTVLLDLDMQFGDCRELLAYEEALRIDELLEMPQRINQARPEAGKVALVCAPDFLEKADQLNARLPELLDLLRAAFDLVVVNTGSFWTDQQVVLLERCNRALFLVDQRPSSLRACRRALDLCTRCGIATSPFAFAINRCSKNALYSSIDVSCAFHGATSLELRDGGRDVEDLMAASQPEDIINSRNPLAESVAKVLAELVPAAKEAGIGRFSDDSRPGWLSSLRRK